MDLRANHFVLEEESRVELDASSNEQTTVCDTKNESSKDPYCAKQNRMSNSAYKPPQKSDQMIAPPPPSIRIRSPEPPPLKRYKMFDVMSRIVILPFFLVSRHCQH